MHTQEAIVKKFRSICNRMSRRWKRWLVFYKRRFLPRILPLEIVVLVPCNLDTASLKQIRDTIRKHSRTGYQVTVKGSPRAITELASILDVPVHLEILGNPAVELAKWLVEEVQQLSPEGEQKHKGQIAGKPGDA